MDIEAILAVLEENPSNSKLSRVFNQLNEWVEEVIEEVIESGQENRTYDDRIIRVCLLAMERHLTRRRLPKHVMIILSNCLCSCVVVNVGLVTGNEFFLRFVFDGFRYVKEMREFENECYDDLELNLSQMLEEVDYLGGPGFRITTVVRYYTQLQQIFHFIFPDIVALFVRRPEYFAIFTTTPSLIRLLLDEMNSSGDEWYEIALTLLGTASAEGSLTAPKLEELLGSGLLKCARHLRKSTSEKHAAIFKRVLQKHPEWRHRFIDLTEGAEGPVERVRKEVALTLSRRKPGVDYVFIDEDATGF